MDRNRGFQVLYLSKRIYNCFECIHKWAEEIQGKFRRWDAEGELQLKRYLAGEAPDPEIERFTNIDDDLKHLDTVHGWTDLEDRDRDCYTFEISTD